jgi:ABC-type polysaccharide/polyol phosphate transport system ATPase subunit
MSDIAIRVEGLGKQYAVGEKLLYRTLRDDIVAFFRAPFSRRRTEKNEGFIWALKDVSFEVKQERS